MPDPAQGRLEFAVQGSPEHLNRGRWPPECVQTGQAVEGFLDAVGGLLLLLRPAPPVALTAEVPGHQATDGVDRGRPRPGQRHRCQIALKFAHELGEPFRSVGIAA
jgi:hypothetical protein